MIAVAGEPNSDTFLVHFHAQAREDAWIAQALEQNVYKDLSGYGRVRSIPAEITQTQDCPSQNIRCFIDWCAEHGVDALMHAVVENDRIRYQVFDIFSDTRIRVGDMSLGQGSDLVRIRLETFRAFKPFLEKGGLLDQKRFRLQGGKQQSLHAATLQDPDVPGLTNPALIMFGRIAALLAIAILLFLVNVFLPTELLKPVPQYKRYKRRWQRPFQGLIWLLLLVIGGWVIKAFEFPASWPLQQWSQQFSWALTVLGGLAWGQFFIINFRFIFPTLKGMDSIKPRVLRRYIGVWLGAAAARFVLLSLLYGVLLYGVWALGALFHVSDRLSVTVLMPVAGLIFYLWLGLMTEATTIFLDQSLVPLNEFLI